MTYDLLLEDIKNYVQSPPAFSPRAYETAQACLLDALGCALLALSFDKPKKLIGPVVPGAVLKNGARVVGTDYQLDPVKAAFDNGLLIRWLDFNDTWLAKEWGHPSDNLGAILAVMDYLGQTNQQQFTVKQLLEAMIKAYEIQGILALGNAFNQCGLDHVILVKLASAAVCMPLLGGDDQALLRVLSQVFVDGQALRTYRHYPNTGSRKSWAAGDACARAVFLCLLTLKGETGYPSAITEPTWGFQDASFRHQPLVLEQAFGSYVMENILFKVAFPAEFHAQTAVEAALILHSQVKDRLDAIDRIEVFTQEAGKRIIDKKGPLSSPADRDHCLQYMIAVPLIWGELSAESYTNTVSLDPRVDILREKMIVKEEPSFTRDYFNPAKRAIPNRIQIFFHDGSQTEAVQVDYPLGHAMRRAEATPLLQEKAFRNISARFGDQRAKKVLAQCVDSDLLSVPVSVLLTLFTA
jgi:2-methylcitrate dehydratase